MKKIVLFVLAASLFSFSLNAMAHRLETPRVLVTGSAVQKVEPDVVGWHVGLRSEGNDSEKLAARHAERLTDLLDYLKKQGLQEKSIKTEQMRLNENWNYRNGKRIKQGYVANSSLSFKSGFEAYAELWKGLAGFNGLSIHSSHFELSDRISIEKQVRKKALLAAKEKAQSMARALGVSIGKPIYIEDLHWGNDMVMPRAAKAMEVMSSASSEPIVSPGELEVRMRVKVEFEIK